MVDGEKIGDKKKVDTTEETYRLLNPVAECDVPVPGIFHFFGGIGTGIGKIWYRKKVSEPVSEKFGPGKSTGIGIENI